MTTTTAPPTTAPIPVSGWDASEASWLAARRKGVSASNVSAVLGFGPYATPWEVWADKTGVRPMEVDADKEAIRLGVAMEPWLLRQAAHLLGREVRRTDARLYAHHAAPWQLASPDGETEDGTLVEAKTAGLASGYGVPAGWTKNRAPLGYELQCRWQMRVMNRPRVALAALVAGLGFVFVVYERDLSIEADMVAQVAEWREQHLAKGVEPPMVARDNDLISKMHPQATKGELRLDGNPEIVELLLTYRDGLDRENAGRAVKEAAAARIKRLVGDHESATVGGQVVATWRPTQSGPRWRDLVEDLIEMLGWDGPDLDLDELIAKYRKPPTRSIDVKGIG